MLVLTRKNRESVVIGRPGEMEIALEITILEIEGGRVRLGFEADNKMPIHRREVWDRICNGDGHGTGKPDGVAPAAVAAATMSRTLVARQPQRDGQAHGNGQLDAAAGQPLAAAMARVEGRRQAGG